MALKLFCLLAFLLVGLITAGCFSPRGPRNERHALGLDPAQARWGQVGGPSRKLTQSTRARVPWRWRVYERLLGSLLGS
jgi:hypothetical protein